MADPGCVFFLPWVTLPEEVEFGGFYTSALGALLSGEPDGAALAAHAGLRYACCGVA
jgi:hypothetical protein